MSDAGEESRLAAGVAKRSVLKLGAGGPHEAEDELAVEAPLEIRVQGQVLATTMRTPGSDDELLAGLLLSEGVLRLGEPIGEIQLSEGAVELRGVATQGLGSALAAARRGTLTSSACGVCGRAGIEDLLSVAVPADPNVAFEAQVLARLTGALSAAQPNFARTGGLHAAGVALGDGRLLVVREDVGRHNAVDKALGRLLLDSRLPLANGVLVVSGRASFEIVQKMAAAGLAALVSVSAPSSLAIEMAERVGALLIGFARGGAFNVYAGRERLRW